MPLQTEFGWSITELSAAVSVNILLFGLTAPFAAALMERFGLRRVTSTALVLIAAGSALSTLVTQSWQLLLTWGLLIGLGTGSMALVFAALVADRWFLKRKGLITGVLTAGSATGQLIFLPIVASIAQNESWRWASLLIAAIALAVVPIVAIFLRNSPADLGMTPLWVAAGCRAHLPRPQPDQSGQARDPGARPRRQGPHLLGTRGGLRHLRGDHQRAGRDPLHPEPA